MPDWYVLMQRADLLGVPFWPASSIFEVPTLVLIWQSIKYEADEKARPELERIAKLRAAMANYHPPVTSAAG